MTTSFKTGILRFLVKHSPEQPAELYMDFFKTGNRNRFERIARRRRSRVSTFVLAECLENKGRFIPALEQIIEILCAEPTWIFPAHDKENAKEFSRIKRGTANFDGEIVTICLFSSQLGYSMATADYLLGDKLSPDIRKLIRKNLRYHIFDPFTKTARGEDEKTY